MNDCNYPLGAEYDKNAPYNEKENIPKDVNVYISVTLGKKVPIYVTDYKTVVDKNEDGTDIHYDFKDCDIVKAVNDQVFTPADFYIVLSDLYKNLKKEVDLPEYIDKSIKLLLREYKDWDVCDSEIILDND